MIEAMPYIPAAARANRGFLQRAVSIVAEAGVKQFIDIGSGLPTMENTHEVAHAADPGIRVAYVDNDPRRSITRKISSRKEEARKTSSSWTGSPGTGCPDSAAHAVHRL
jgi:hypothetical protein